MTTTNRRFVLARAAVFFVALVGLASCVYASTDVGDIIENWTPEETRDLTVQSAIVDTFAQRTGGGEADFSVAIIGSSNGTFVPEVTRAVQSSSLDSTSKQSLRTLFEGTPGGSASAQQLEAGLNVVNGVSSLAGVGAGSIATAEVGGSGGVVQTRQLAVLTERRGLAEQFGSNSSLASAAMNKDNARRLWFSPFHTNQKGDRNGTTEAYKYKANGVSLGYDHAFGAITAGGVFTFSNGEYDVTGVRDDNTIKNYGISGYAQYFSASNCMFVTVAGGYNRGNNTWNRFVEAGVDKWERGKNHTNSYWAGANIGRDLVFGSVGKKGGLTLTPTIGVFWSESRSTSYKATGVVAKELGEMKQRTVVVPVEVEARKSFVLGADTRATLKGQAGYSYNIKNEGAKGTVRYDYVGAEAFNVVGTAPGRHGYNLGAGVKVEHRNVEIGVDYRYDKRKKFQGHRVSATLGVNF